MRFSAVNEFFVNLIGKHGQIIFLAYLRYSAYLFLGIHRARRVTGAVENKHFRSGRNHIFNLSRGHFISVASGGHNVYRHPSAAFYDFGICQPVRFRNKHFVARIYRCEYCVENRVFRTV